MLQRERDDRIHEDREQPEEAELTGFANDDLETMMLDGE